jgi:outer membrane protein assembly factor BamD
MAAAVLAIVAATALSIGCAGSIPSIPNTPEAILEKAQSYFENDRFFQSGELYKGFLARHPGHDRSDFAQFRLAESYFGQDEYALAAVEYQVLIWNYGYSEYVDDSLFKIGVSFWNEAPSVKRDQQKTRDALSRFEQFLQTFPNSPLVPQVQEHIKVAHERLAEKAFLNVRWYYRIKKYNAALIYCDKIIESYPDNKFWAQAVYYKGLILMGRGKRDEAAQQFALVLAYPDDVPVKKDARDRLEDMRE